MMMSSCSSTHNEQIVPDSTVRTLTQELAAQCPADSARLARGIAQAAALWCSEDGTEEEFEALVRQSVRLSEAGRDSLFESVCLILERCYEAGDMLSVELLRPTQLTNAGAPTDADYIMSAYSPMAHFSDDMFANKLAFVIILNYPHYTLEEKNTFGRHWSRKQWAEARLGDQFTTRVPASVLQQVSQAQADAENYISDYNIYMGSIENEQGEHLWNKDVVLLSHWNLRDELKAQYADTVRGPERQEMIYEVMKRIVTQEIPAEVINHDTYTWRPISNTCYREGKTVNLACEPDTRYERILGHMRAYREMDQYCPMTPSQIDRNFGEGVEMPAEQLDSLFRALLGSEEVAMVAREIQHRLGRALRPYDIWYDGFKARATMSEDALTAQTRALYPDAEAFARDMPRLLQQMGFAHDNAEDLASHIVVEPARGSGHAWPTLGRQEPARLRTRIADSGMDYKGYNIAVHEFGHTVEQVLDMYRIDYYTLAGVPNTGYTEASAFLWQQRDLKLLPTSPTSNTSPTSPTSSTSSVLDQFWSMYEIMGVSLVDMTMWRWLYAHPEAIAAELKAEVLRIAREVWNRYYAPVLGEEDSPLLAIYSHMVDVPMYLPNYPIGHIVQYQLEEHLQQYSDPAAWAAEYERIYRLGRLTPNEWMRQAVGAEPSIDPVLKAVRHTLCNPVAQN